MHDLLDFLPPAAHSSAVLAAVQQLQQSATAPVTDNPPQYPWIMGTAMRPKDVESGGIVSPAVPPPQTTNHSELKVTAREFQPTASHCVASESATDFENLAGVGEGSVDDYFVMNEKDDPGTGGPSMWSMDARAGQIGQSSQYYLWAPDPPPVPSPSSSSSSTMASSLSLGRGESAAIAVLSQQFPEYSHSALQSLFAQSGRSLPATMELLFSMESELMGQSSSVPASSTTTKDPEFSREDFPSLGGGGGGSGSAVATLPFGANYAGRAKAAALMPETPSLHVPRAQQKGATTIGGGGGLGFRGGGSGKAVPVWESSGIQRFSTGATVAAEYAELRADARDHARLRNACFQNATQAYLAGNKALAKELGAKGRWHNEQMKAAHATAAADTFSRRNAAVFESSTLAAGRSHRGGVGNAEAEVPTIDLHGLHVSEALDHLEQTLEQLQRHSSVRSVRIVVGVGQHGKVPARLPAAVKRFLTDRRVSCREPYAGLLEVTLR